MFDDDFFKAQSKGKIVLVGHSNEFLVKSVHLEMNRRNYEAVVCDTSIDEINGIYKDASVLLLFVDSAESIKDLLVYLKDIAFEKRIEIGLVGERLEIQEAARFISAENIGKLFARPVDAKQISDGLEELHKIATTKSERKRILIIDDDPAFLNRTKDVLHNHYRVYIANSGASAFMLLAKHKVDLILLDYLMPVLDGPKVLETLKHEPDTADIPVIFLSGQTDVRSITKAMTLGSETYLSKSLAAKELAANISDFFAKRDWEEMNYGH